MTAKIIGGLTHAQYDAIEAEHNGGLRQILISPRAYQAHLAAPREETDAMRLGLGEHTAVLQIDRFRRDYIVWAGGKRYGKEWDAFKAAADVKGQTILKDDQLDQVVTMAWAVHEHKRAAEILEQKGRAELTITWTDDKTGIPLKARLDWLTSDNTILADLKTCRDPSPARFATSSAQMGYHMQMALYADAVAEAGLGTPEVKIVAAQNVSPYDVVVYSLDENMLLIGRQLYERALDVLVECRRTNQWPGISPEEEVPLAFPAWATPQEDLTLTANGEVFAV